MKVVVIHPPLYPVNYTFYNLLAKKVDLTLYILGEHPIKHKTWTVGNFITADTNFKIRQYGKGPIDTKTKINPIIIYHLHKDKPDLVLSIAFWLPSLYASLLKKILGYKFVILTNATARSEKNRSGLTKKLRQLITLNTDAFISASDLTSKYLNSIAPKIKTYLSLQTIDINAWAKDINLLPAKQELRQELNLSKDKTILLGVGNFVALKNWESIFTLVQQHTQYYFILIGYGKLQKQYESFIKKYQLESNIQIVSKKEGLELLQYYKASDIFVFPTLNDTFGFVVPEALASSLPVLCSEYAGASSLIKDNENGFVVNPNKNFKKELDTIKENLDIFSNKAYNSIKKYTIENRVEEFITIFEDTLKQ